MYEYGTANRPIVIKEITQVTVGETEYNALVIPEGLYRALSCEKFQGRRVFAVVTPTLEATDTRELAVTYKDSSDVAPVLASGRSFISADTRRLQPYAGTRKLVSFVMDWDDAYRRAWRLEGVHEVCALHG